MLGLRKKQKNGIFASSHHNDGFADIMSEVQMELFQYLLFYWLLTILRYKPNCL